MLRQVKAAAESTLKEKGQSVTVHCTLEYLQGDFVLLQSLLLNLIDNAAKIPGQYAPGTENADKRALPAIWNDQAGFQAAAARLGTDAAALQASTDTVGFQVALKTVQGDCAACHNSFRGPHDH